MKKLKLITKTKLIRKIIKLITIKTIIIVFLFLSFLSFISSLVLAQSFSLGIMPPLLEVMIKPGKTITQVYHLSNQGANSQVYANFVAFKPSDELGNIELRLQDYQADSEDKPKWLNWFSFQNADLDLPGGFLLKSGQTQQLVLKIRVPLEAEEKDYYGALVFQVKPGKGMMTSGPQASGIISSNVLLTVSKTGLPPKDGQIIEFSVKKIFSFFDLSLAIFDSFDTIPFTLRIANTGRTFFKPQGSVKIINFWGKEDEFLSLLPQNVLAHSQRKLFLKGNEESLVKEITWQPRGFKIGRYQAKASLLLSDSDKKLEAQTSFFIFPWKASLGFIIAYILLNTIKKFLKKVL